MPVVPSSRAPSVPISTAGVGGFVAPQVAIEDARLPTATISTPQLSTPHLEARRLEPLRVDPNAIRPIELSDGGARQMMQVGEQMSRVDSAVFQAARDMQVKANAAVVDDALNQAREVAARVTYGHKDPQTGQIVGGYRNLKGYDAIKRPDDKSLDDEVVEDYQNQVKQIAGSRLTNPAQRRAFEMQANDIQLQLRQGALIHQSEQFNDYYQGVYTNQVKNLTTDFASLDPGDLDTQHKKMDQIEGAVGSLAVHNGASAQELAVGVRGARSAAVSGLFEQAIVGKKYATAQALLNTWGKEIEPNVAVKLKSALDGRVAIQAGEQIADDTWTHWAAPSYNAGDADRGYNVLLATEHRGAPRQVGDDGKTITSPKGAYGVGQLMPDTALAVAKSMGRPELAEVAKQPTKEGEAANRLISRTYFNSLVTKFNGDMPKAYAAYNAGPGVLLGGTWDGVHHDGALKEAAQKGGDWRDYIPKETKDYVTYATNLLGSGAGAPPKPSREQLLAQIDARTSDPQVRQAAYAKLDRHLTFAEADERAQYDRSYSDGIRIVEQTGDINAVPPELRAKIKPEQREQLATYAKGVAEGKTNPTDMAAYYQLSDDKTLKGLTHEQLWAYRPMLSTEDFRSMANHWADLQKPQPGKDPGSLDTSAVKEIVDTRLRFLGIDPAPSPKTTSKDDQARIGAIHQFVRDAILTRQQQTGQKLEYKDIEQTINQLFSRNETFRTTVMGVTTGHGTQNVMTSRANDLPADTRQQIVGTLQKHGIKDPSEAQVLDAYWRSKFFR